METIMELLLLYSNNIIKAGYEISRNQKAHTFDCESKVVQQYLQDLEVLESLRLKYLAECLLEGAGICHRFQGDLDDVRFYIPGVAGDESAEEVVREAMKIAGYNAGYPANDSQSSPYEVAHIVVRWYYHSGESEYDDNVGVHMQPGPGEDAWRRAISSWKCAMYFHHMR